MVLRFERYCPRAVRILWNLCIPLNIGKLIGVTANSYRYSRAIDGRHPPSIFLFSEALDLS
jgi:hypothetical protein